MLNKYYKITNHVLVYAAAILLNLLSRGAYLKRN
jgi:hypothetical protein